MSESFIHSDIKGDIYFSLLEEDVYAESEKRVGHTVTDILTATDWHTVAIEIQHTRIPIKSILRRMREHTDAGFHTLWLISPEALIYEKGVRSLNWVLFIQRIQNGVIFLPGLEGGAKVIPCRVDNSLMLKNNEITAGRKWLEKMPEIEINELLFEKNDDYGLHICSIPDTWSESYYNFLGDVI